MLPVRARFAALDAGGKGISGAILLTSGFGVALNLAMPFILPLEEYARYSLLFGLAQLVASLGFEWLRIGLLRYGGGREAASADRRLAVLAWGYLLVAAALMVAALLAAFYERRYDWSQMVALVLLCAVLQGAFDGQQALARAKQNDTLFIQRSVSRAALGLLLSLVGAAVFRTGHAALIGFALAFPVSAVLGARFSLAVLGVRFDRGDSLALVRFGVVAAMSTNLTVLVPSLARSTIVAALGMLGAGGVLLAFDLSLRVFSTIGMAVNATSMQRAIRAADARSGAETRASVAVQVSQLPSVLCPLVILMAALGPGVGSPLVPVDYQAAFGGSLPLVAATAALMALRQYAVEPLFVILERPGGALFSSSVAVLALWSMASLAHTHEVNASGFALEPLLLSQAVGLIAAGVLATMLLRLRWPTAELARIAAASAVMSLATYLLPGAEGMLLLGFEAVALLGAYLATWIALGRALSWFEARLRSARFASGAASP
jgi:hypothetical protein